MATEAIAEELFAVTEKVCTRCKTARPLNMFAPSKNTRSRLHSNCRLCQRILTRVYRLGLTLEVASTPLPEDGRCEVCGARPPNLGLCLDHDHATGAFRGWLCNSCNSAMGHAGDSAERLRELADYLDRKAGAISAA